MELKADLSKPGRARLLRSVGKRTRGGATDERDLTRFRPRFWIDAVCSNNNGRTRNALIAPLTGFKEERVHHPRSPHLRATIHLKQLSSCRRGAAAFSYRVRRFAPSRCSASTGSAASSRLPHLVRLTRREQEVARLVCEGRSNQEIADDARLSLPMVKKHLHAVFRKLEVPSRSRLMTLMR